MSMHGASQSIGVRVGRVQIETENQRTLRPHAVESVRLQPDATPMLPRTVFR